MIHAVSAVGIGHESAKHQHPNDQDHQERPRVLLLGDSISMGYTPFVKQQLSDIAEVQRPKANCGPTTRGLLRLDEWLGNEAWDVIHFNFGLHDLKYVADGEQLVAVDQGSQQVPIDQYMANLSTIAKRLKSTGATLIWCTTTPVPAGAKGRVPGDSRKYNVAAHHALQQVLGEDLVIDDLFEFSQPRLAEIQQPANVHFTKAGSEQLATQVSQSIRTALASTTKTMARGTVFEDRNANGQFDEGDQPLPEIRVSNGREIVLTNEDGQYELPISDDAHIFVIKPRGYRTPVDDKQLPLFYYLHKPNGSPETRFAGVKPTGPLPESIDFPLMAQDEPHRFRAIMFGDPQPRDQKEVDYIAHDVVEQLIGTDASLGVTLGDITFDNLALFEPQAQAIAVLGIPWYNVIGNHDLNFDAPTDDLSDESFERVFGPSYYSFDHGPVHFLVLDDVEWLVDANGKGRYQGGLGERQMEFIRRDLSLIPEKQLVVLMMHIPLTGVRDRQDLYRLIEKRPFSMSISAHTHTHEHRYITREDGWRGPEAHHHVINVTVSGGWWSGQLDERGLPHTLMADGAPNGFSIIEFDGHQYSIDFRPAARPADYQIAIHAPEVVRAAEIETVAIYANVFNGSARSEVTLNVGDQAFPMKHVRQEDPMFVEVREREEKLRAKLVAQGVDKGKLWTRMPSPGESSHLWRVELPVTKLNLGVNRLAITAKLNVNPNDANKDHSTVSGSRLIRRAD